MPSFHKLKWHLKSSSFSPSPLYLLQNHTPPGVMTYLAISILTLFRANDFTFVPGTTLMSISNSSFSFCCIYSTYTAKPSNCTHLSYYFARLNELYQSVLVRYISIHLIIWIDLFVPSLVLDLHFFTKNGNNSSASISEEVSPILSTMATTLSFSSGNTFSRV